MENADPTMEDLFTGLGIDPGTETDPTPDPDPETDPEPGNDPDPASGAGGEGGNPNEGNGSPGQQNNEPPAQINKDIKAQQAFIHLRQQNQRYGNMLKSIAQMLEIDPKNLGDDQLLSALQEKVNANAAKAQNVPVELINRLQQLEERDREYSLRTRQSEVENAFRSVQSKFNLTAEQLLQFSEDLVKAGKNPVQADIDMVAEYRNMHFDELMNDAVAKAVAAEQARAAKAASQSSTPDPSRGKSSGEDGDKINTQQQLTEWMKANMK